MINKWQGKRVLVIGAARQGLALARFLSTRGAVVTLNDQQSDEQLADIRREAEPMGVTCVFGGHPESLLERIDLVCVSGGVPLTLPLIADARSKEIPISNDSQIFFDEVAAPVIGITGSAGKTTTTTLFGRMAVHAAGADRKAWVGGNIGNPLLDCVDAIKSDDIVVLELSSFQLELMTSSPRVAAILNITPNHLDRHGTMEVYSAIKARILDFQTKDDIAILNREDPGSWALVERVKSNIISFGMEKPSGSFTGTYTDGVTIFYSSEGKEFPIFALQNILLKGRHNLMNVLAACAIGMAAGFQADAVSRGIEGFQGVAHRLELVRELHGVRWYNDSIATAPERTAAAIRSFEEPIVLMLGGRDKNLPWVDLATLIRERVDHVVIFGELAGKIAPIIGGGDPYQRPFTVNQCQTLQEAVDLANQAAESGNVVLFSPGGTSFDAFKDFEQRGESFRSWVNQLS
jgi:UDP-N-acetylmuramoylalanine--D-glutamate ligase